MALRLLRRRGVAPSRRRGGRCYSGLRFTNSSSPGWRRPRAARSPCDEFWKRGQRVNRLFTLMKKGCRQEIGSRQSQPFVHTRRFQETAGFLPIPAIDGRRALPTRPGQDHGDEDAIGDNLAAVNARLEELTRRFDRGVQASPSTVPARRRRRAAPRPRHGGTGEARSPDRTDHGRETGRSRRA